MSDNAEDAVYAVVISDEEQYSLWPKNKDVPTGWRDVGIQGSKDECLRYIDEAWTDMRPLSLRRWLLDPDESK